MPACSRRDRGSVTAETAMVLPVLLVVLAMAVWVLAGVSTQLRAVDAAYAGARAAARGDAAADVQATARSVAPEGATVQVSRVGDVVHVRVSAVVSPLGQALGGLADIEVSGRATAAAEDAVGR